jgi:microcystin-dependent protein
MAEPFLSEIRLLSFGYATRGWALCNAQVLSLRIS